MQKLGARQILSYSLGSFAAGMFFALNNFTLPLYLKLK